VVRNRKMKADEKVSENVIPIKPPIPSAIDNCLGYIESKKGKIADMMVIIFDTDGEMTYRYSYYGGEWRMVFALEAAKSDILNARSVSPEEIGND